MEDVVSALRERACRRPIVLRTAVWKYDRGRDIGARAGLYNYNVVGVAAWTERGGILVEHLKTDA